MIKILLIAAGVLAGAPFGAEAATRVMAWGSNDTGQTNVPSGLTNVIAIAAGFGHGLALQADGTVVGWGRNYLGQADVPVDLESVVAIAAGSDHSLALKSDRTVVAWGSNFAGQTNVPPGLNDVVGVSGGREHSLALKADGTVVAWGSNTSGQSSIPVGLNNIVAVAAGGDTSLALTADGRVIAWGDNAASQASVPAWLTNVVAIAAGDGYSLALMADGRATAWGGYGNSNATELGYGYGNRNLSLIASGGYGLALSTNGKLSGSGGAPAWPNWPFGPTGIVAIAAGGSFSLALVGDGPPSVTTLLANRTAAQGGNVFLRTTATGLPPLSYQWRFNGTDVPGATNAVLRLVGVQPSQAGAYSVVVGNTIWETASQETTVSVAPVIIEKSPYSQHVFWGATAALDVVASGQEPISYQWRYNGVPLAGATNSSLVLTNLQLNQSGNYDVVVSTPFGTVESQQASLSVSQIAAWGNDTSGQTDVPLELTNVVAIAAGGDNSVAVMVDGTVAVWGDNSRGQLSVPPGLSNVVAVSTGATYTYALQSDGTVASWGSYPLYFGVGPASIPSNLTNVVALMDGGAMAVLKGDGSEEDWFRGGTSTNFSVPNIVAIAAELALRSDGTVISYSDPPNTNLPPGLTNVVTIAAGYSHRLALKADGTVVAWLAVGGDGSYSQTQVPHGLTDVVAISASGNHSLALRTDGTVAAWGSDDSKESEVPAGLSNVVAIAASPSHSLALVWNGPPLLSNAAKDQIVPYGGAAVFLSRAPGHGPLRYQWKFNGSSLPAATNAFLSLTNINYLQEGAYSVTVSNAFGEATSPESKLRVVPFLISTQPQSQSAFLASTVTLKAAVNGQGPFAYQWLFNGRTVPGATNSSLTLRRVQTSQSGTYAVIIDSPFGSVQSQDAFLTVGSMSFAEEPPGGLDYGLAPLPPADPSQDFLPEVGSILTAADGSFFA
jgi:alpha-tubulin suppressor-like RCC1 family protein